MSTVTARVYGKDYTLACDDGQEAHLEGLIAQVVERTERLGGHLGRIPDSLMLLYSALMLADELHELRQEAARMRQQVKQSGNLSTTAAPNAELEAKMASTLEDIAARIESINAKLA